VHNLQSIANKILQFSSYAEPKSKCLLLFEIDAAPNNVSFKTFSLLRKLSFHHRVYVHRYINKLEKLTFLKDSFLRRSDEVTCHILSLTLLNRVTSLEKFSSICSAIIYFGLFYITIKTSCVKVKH
jgi:hypothetical protein